MDVSLKAAQERADVLTTRIEPLSMVVEGLRDKCGGDTLLLSDEERERMDAASATIAPLLVELNAIKRYIIAMGPSGT